MAGVCSSTVSLPTEVTAISYKIELAAIIPVGSTIQEYGSQICKLTILVSLHFFIPYINTDQSSGVYYRPFSTFLDCSVLEFDCSSSLSLPQDASCVVSYYGGDSQYQQLQALQNYTVNGAGVLALNNTVFTHYFTLSLRISSTLSIEEMFTFETPTFCVQPSEFKFNCYYIIHACIKQLFMYNV